MSLSNFDYQMMARALRLAKLGEYTARPNPMVGCVITQQESIVGEGHHHQAGTAHAEINALQQAGTRAKAATAYVTLEPCAHTGRTGPCANALIDAGIGRVVVAMRDPFPEVSGKGIARLKAAGIVVDGPCLEQQARELNAGFLTRVEAKRPFVTLKMGMSLDGKIALSNGQSQWITSSQARADVQLHRAQSDAILTGSGTVLADNPNLQVRMNEAPQVLKDVLLRNPLAQFEQPLRVVLDSHNRVGEQGMFQSANAPVCVFNVIQNDALPTHNKQIRIPLVAERPNLSVMMEKLAQMQLNRVWVEAGSGLAGALLEGHCVDELVLYQAPVILGDKAQGAFAISDLTQLQDAVKFTLKEQRTIGPDQKFIFSLEP